MKPQSTRIVCILPMLICGACTQSVWPTPDVSETVIESILPTRRDQPWRLDSAWQNGGLGGAVYRASSLEHVVRQVDQEWVFAVDHTDAHTISVTDQLTEVDDPLMVERAWRKYCHHQLDMTPEEHALISLTQIPHQVLSHGCNPGSLKK